MAHHIAGIDVYTKLLVVVVVDVAKPDVVLAAREIRYRCE